MTQYFYFVGTEKIGPVSAKDIRNATAAGMIFPNTLIELDDGRQFIARNIRGINFPEPSTKCFEVPVVPIIPCAVPDVHSEVISVEEKSKEENSSPVQENNVSRLINYLRNKVSAKTLKALGIAILFLAGPIFFLCSYTSPENLRREGIYVVENSENEDDVTKKENAEKRGFRLLAKAAKKGDSLALVYLAECYNEGIGVESDEHEYLHLIQKAASKDCPEALWVLADIYADGRMVQRNEEEAKNCRNKANQLFLNNVQILREKAKKGNRNAQFDLGYYYYRGCGVERDFLEAIKWWDMADKNGYKLSGEAKYTIQIYHDAQNGKPEEQYKYASRLYHNGEKWSSIEWYEKAANQGNVDAMYSLGDYIEDYHVKSTSKTKFEWLKAAAEHGHASAQYEIGIKYLFGDEEDGVEMSKKLAEKWLLAAAKQEYKSAYFSLGLLYRRSNKKEAARWFRMCGEDNKIAMECLRELNL